MEKQKKVAVNIREVPEDLKQQFKALCVINNITMQKGFILIMERAVRTGKL